MNYFLAFGLAVFGFFAFEIIWLFFVAPKREWGFWRETAPIILVAAALIITLFLTAPPPVYTGEIVKFYANGTALLDNGTLIIWPPGCPPCGG